MQASAFQTTYHIARDGSGDFSSIREALYHLSRADKEQAASVSIQDSAAMPVVPVTLQIHSGVYPEQLTIDRPFLTLIGDGPEDTILTGALYARMPSDDIGKLGTFRTYSCRIAAHDVTLKGLTLENSAGRGPDVGQALALYADGDRLVFENCRFLGNQDTLFTAPLPPKEIEPNGFVGPGQFAPRINGRHYYKNCYLEGDIDFVFGGATAYFEECEFFSKDIGRAVNSYVTAASTPAGQSYGYVMDRCRFTGSCPPHSAYLGRPWREFAQTVLLNCEIGAHICEEGWHDWDKPYAHDTVLYAEFGSTGPSSAPEKRPDWVRILTFSEAEAYSRQSVLSGSDHWNPA